MIFISSGVKARQLCTSSNPVEQTVLIVQVVLTFSHSPFPCSELLGWRILQLVPVSCELPNPFLRRDEGSFEFEKS